MIISRKPHEPLFPPAEADVVLDGIKFRFSSGNACVVTPSMRKLAGGDCRINVNYAWEKNPSDAEQIEMENEIGRMLGRAPEFMTNTLTRAASERVQDDWLASGKVPGNVRRKQ